MTGRVSAEIARLHAETEFEKYRIIQDPWGSSFLTTTGLLAELEEQLYAAKPDHREENPEANENAHLYPRLHLMQVDGYSLDAQKDKPQVRGSSEHARRRGCDEGKSGKEHRGPP